MRFFLLMTALCVPAIFAQENSPPSEMEAMAQMGALAPEHKILEKMVGEWKTVSSFWMTPDAEAVKSEGSVSAKAILGGRYIMAWDKGSAMGMPYEGLAITGYDKHKKAFTLSWRSSMDTSTVLGEGQYDEATKTISFKGKMVSPMMDGSMIDYRFTTEIVDDNHLVDTMYMIMDGHEMKAMEIASERVK